MNWSLLFCLQLFPTSTYHKEGLLTKEECVSINETLGNWCKVVVHKRSEEAMRIVDMFEAHGLDDEAQRIKG